MLLHILIAVDERKLQEKLKKLLTRKDTIVEILDGHRRIWERIPHRTLDLLIVSRELITGRAYEQINKLKKSPESPSVVVLSDREDEQEHVRLIAAGCDAVLNPQLSIKKLGSALNSILDRRRKTAEPILTVRPEPGEAQISDFVAVSPAMSQFVKLIPRVARSNSSVLILGETGVGKERLAHVIHTEGSRPQGPFVAVHCGALPESLLESELFGHEQGAFTGAIKSRRGCFELAHQGIIFLDEIGEMPLHLQSKLLRVLESREIRRVGGEKPISVDVRLITATNRDIEAAVKAKEFRQDLYYRLNVVSLTIPTLRERVEDIPELVQSYIEYLGPRIGCEVSGITDEALDALCRYTWPGNVRELINVIERAMLLCESDLITADDLPQSITQPQFSPDRLSQQLRSFPEQWLQKPLKKAAKEIQEQFERGYLTALLTSAKGRVAQAAKHAGIDSRTLFEKMKKYALSKKDFRT